MRSQAPDSERRDRIRTALRSHRIDALVCSLPSQILLLTGFWPVMATSIAIFTAEGQVHLLVPEDEEELAERTCRCERTSFRSAQLDTIVDAQTAIRSPLVDLIKKLHLNQSRIGVESRQFLQPSSYAVMSLYLCGLQELLRSEFPTTEIVPADAILEELKTRKTAWELDRIRTTAKFAGSAFDAARTYIAPGMREAEVASCFQAAFERTQPAPDIQRSYGYFFCMSGPNAAKADAAYARTRHRTIEQGDVVMVHCNTCADGFWTDITRTYTAGQADAKQENMHSAIMQARQAAISAIKPGVQAKDVDRAARDVLQHRGFGQQFKHATGHGVGFAAANHNALPRIHPQSPDVLTAGMTFNIEPAIYFEGYGGMRHCDVVGITSTGVEVFTDF
ncbi:MAG: Xaa-Pro peptidase family protein [Candidatus Sulfotelmatobacter sp.]